MTNPTVDTAVADQLRIAQARAKAMIVRVIVKNLTDAFPDSPAPQKTDLYQAYIQARTFCAYYESLPD